MPSESVIRPYENSARFNSSGNKLEKKKKRNKLKHSKLLYKVFSFLMTIV